MRLDDYHGYGILPPENCTDDESDRDFITTDSAMRACGAAFQADPEVDQAWMFQPWGSRIRRPLT